MHIDEAIKQLKEAKKEGRKHIILAWWDAAQFEREDDKVWATLAESLEEEMDWSHAHDAMSDLIGEMLERTSVEWDAAAKRLKEGE